MEVKVKNRGWVKNAAIIFLAVMLVLTFFSNTFMNHSLAEVATQSVTSGSITAKVRGTGTVESNGSYQVKAEATREIRAVMVKVGQEVNQGDVLFVLGEGPSEELDAATEQLRQLQLSYQRTAVNMPSFDYSLDERNIAKAKETLANAQAAENSAKAALEQNANVPEDELKDAQALIGQQKTAGDSEGPAVAAHVAVVKQEKGRRAEEQRAPGLDAAEALDARMRALVGAEQLGDQKQHRPACVETFPPQSGSAVGDQHIEDRHQSGHGYSQQPYDADHNGPHGRLRPYHFVDCVTFFFHNSFSF